MTKPILVLSTRSKKTEQLAEALAKSDAIRQLQYQQLAEAMARGLARALQPVQELARQLAAQTEQLSRVLAQARNRTVVPIEPRVTTTREEKPLIGFRPRRKV